ncbi:hypothetical protein, partial [Lentzea sp. NBRC 102530]|uniref:hypothetical protein n=1 Tax=Lentzea sp. NBRC 102530 TaxID=3032201 RepID=UPI00255294C4
KLKAAGENKIARELGKAMRATTAPLVNEAKKNVRALQIKGDGEAGSATRRGGSSARLARYRMALGRKKILREERKLEIYRASRGLRDTVANAVAAKTTVSARSASLRVRAAQSKMPHDQRKLPRYLNRGEWRHPIFGDRDSWAKQTAPPAWFDDAGRTKGPLVLARANLTVSHFVDRIL